MNPSPSETWIKRAIILGMIGTILVLFVPLFLSRHVQSERARRAGCEREERVDCEPSVIWLLMK